MTIIHLQFLILSYTRRLAAPIKTIIHQNQKPHHLFQNIYPLRRRIIRRPCPISHRYTIPLINRLPFAFLHCPEITRARAQREPATRNLNVHLSIIIIVVVVVLITARQRPPPAALEIPLDTNTHVYTHVIHIYNQRLLYNHSLGGLAVHPCTYRSPALPGDVN